MLIGLGVSPYIAIGKAVIIKEQARTGLDGHAEDVDREIERLRCAIEESKEQVRQLALSAAEKNDRTGAEIIENHINFLQDPAFNEDAVAAIRETARTAESVIADVTEKMGRAFLELGDAYFSERAADVKDVGERILANLQGRGTDLLGSIEPGSILVAHDLTPSQTVSMDKSRIGGFVTEIGGKTSHTAILARSLGIAAVTGCAQATEQIREGAVLVVDGLSGEVIVDPDPEREAGYQMRIEQARQEAQRYLLAKSKKLYRSDGRAVEVAANIGDLMDALEAKRDGADGVGLFRTEFLYMSRQELPTEEEQYAVYSAVAEVFGDSPVIIRTLDIGGDKQLPGIQQPHEDNPFLGVRAIRLCLRNQDLFKTQLRALLRAGVKGRIHIMFPMIGSLAELSEAKALLETCKDELRQEGTRFSEDIPVGIMIEIPSAAILADEFAKQVDFFSIGTNDLTQYTLAVDRGNAALGGLYDSMHPAVLSLIRHTIEAAHRNGIPCGMCGELAGDQAALKMLLEMGLDEFSVDHSSVARVKSALIECEGIVTRI